MPMFNKLINKLKPKIEPAHFDVREFTSCCTAKIFCGFWDWPADQIIARCNQLIPELDRDGCGVVVAITTDQETQRGANEAFERMGWHTNPTPIKKDRNPYSGDLHVWFMPVKEYKPIEL